MSADRQADVLSQPALPQTDSMEHTRSSGSEGSPHISVHFMTTGHVQIKQSMRSQRADRFVLFRRLRAMADRSWTEPLPVGCFLIRHPEGPFLFDTGQSPKCNDPGYNAAWMPLPGLLAKFAIKHEDGVGPQLRSLGVAPEDVKAVILSHLHGDHAGGLADLPGVPVFTSEAHWNAFKEPIHATIEGCLPQHWPKDFPPSFLKPSGPAIGPWSRSFPITSDGSITAVETPGHVPGHMSLIVRASDATYLLTGDATYGMDLLENELTDGINDDPLAAIESLRKIKAFAQSSPIVVLPSHDPHVADILASNKVYTPSVRT